MRAEVCALSVMLSAFALSACSHAVSGLGASDSAAGRAEWRRERMRLAIDHLDRGQARRARAELRAVLGSQPNHAGARSLLQQIETEPRALLGEQARPYLVRPGETMSEIAEHQLGDRLLFYALARYNNLAAPNALQAGQTLMVPSRAQAAPQPASSRRADPARANQLRLQALERLNAGQVEAAVTLLREARALDAGNASIQRDLDRALRLQASLRSDEE